MNQRALDLAVLMHGQLAAIGPEARSLSVNVIRPWTFIRIGVTTDDALRALAVDFELEQARTERRGRIWWRRASSQAGRLIVVAAGPYYEGEP